MIIIANLIVISFMGQSNYRTFNEIANPRNQTVSEPSAKLLKRHKEVRKSNRIFKPKAKSSNFSLATKQKLDSLVYQDFDEFMNDWFEYYKNEYTYNSNGMVLNEIGYSNIDGKGDWIPSYKYEYIYLIDDMPVEEFRYDFDDLANEWVNSWKYLYEYDENGNMIMEISFGWDTDFNQWVFEYKEEYSYNSSSDIELHSHYTWNFEVGQWYYASKQEYTYDENGNLVFRLFSIWDNESSQWLGNNKSDFINDEDGILQNEMEYMWNLQLSEWELAYKQDYEYNTNGNLVSVSYFQWDEIANDWIGNYKEEYVYDADGNVAEFYDHGWDEESGQWVFDFKSSFTFDNSYAYDDLVLPFDFEEDSEDNGVNLFNHMITEAVSNEYNGSLWENQEKIGLYYSSIEVGIHEYQMLSVTVYPNPATDFVSFRLDEGPQKMQLEIIDMFGKVVLNQQISNAQQVSVKQLNPALYFYRLNDGNRVLSSGKLSIQ